MLLTTVLVATLSSVPSVPAASAVDAGVSLITAYEEVLQAEHAGVGEATLKLTSDSVAPRGGIMALTEAASLSAHTGPFDGAAMSQTTRAIVAMVLGFAVGFGIGHIVAQDKASFVMFLIIDIAIITVAIVMAFIPIYGWAGYLLRLLPWAAWVGSHVWQGIDAWGKASGDPIVRRSIDSTIRVTGAPDPRWAPAVATRTFGFNF